MNFNFNGMKKIFYFIAAAFALGSCSQEELINTDVETGNVGHVLMAGAPSSRLHVGVQQPDRNSTSEKPLPDYFNVKWSAGDKFTAFNVDGTKSVDYAIVEEGAKFPADNAKFIAPENITPTFAIYPKSATPTTTDGKKVSFVLKETFGESVSQNAPMFGEVKDGHVHFIQLMAMIKFQFTNFLPKGCSTVKIVSNKVIAGGFHIADITKDKSVLADADNTDSKTVTITNVASGEEFYLPVPAMTGADFAVYAVATDGTETDLKLNLTNKTLNAGKIYNVIREVKVNEEKVEFVYSKDKVQLMENNSAALTTYAGKWFGLSTVMATSPVEAGEDALIMNVNNSDSGYGKVVNGGYCVPANTLSKGVYKVDVTLSASNKVDGVNKLTILFESSHPKDGNKPYCYNVAGKDEGLEDRPKGTTGTIREVKTVNVDETISTFVDFGKIGAGTGSGATLAVNDKDGDKIAAFAIRFWSQKSGATDANKCTWKFKKIVMTRIR